MSNSIVSTHLSVIIRLGFNRSHQIKVTLNIYITFPMRIPYHNLHCFFLESEHRSFTASRMCQNFRWPASPVRRTTDLVSQCLLNCSRDFSFLPYQKTCFQSHFHLTVLRHGSAAVTVTRGTRQFNPYCSQTLHMLLF